MSKLRALVRVEQFMRHLGASLLAGGLLISGPFAAFSLGYKTYNLVKLGHWYAWGAPTPIGLFNRIMSLLLIVTLVVGVTLLASAAALRRRIRTEAPTPTEPIAPELRSGASQFVEHPEQTLLPTA